MRNRCKGCFLPDVVLTIARNYDLLLSLCKVSVEHHCHGSVDRMDIFHDTILAVSHDPKCRNFHTNSDLIEYFRYRYRMISYQTYKDEKQRDTLPYADYLKTEENQ